MADRLYKVKETKKYLKLNFKTFVNYGSISIDYETAKQLRKDLDEFLMNQVVSDGNDYTDYIAILSSDEKVFIHIVAANIAEAQQAAKQYYGAMKFRTRKMTEEERSQLRKPVTDNSSDNKMIENEL